VVSVRGKSLTALLVEGALSPGNKSEATWKAHGCEREGEVSDSFAGRKGADPLQSEALSLHGKREGEAPSGLAGGGGDVSPGNRRKRVAQPRNPL
jgi:hypothetical protein